MENLAPNAWSSAYQKANLIREALKTLQEAHSIDERDDLNATNYLEWYDRTIPDVRDLEFLAAAMKIELARRRGDQIEKEGELRGGESKVSQCLTLPPNKRRQRSEDRAIAKQPEAVQAFVQREVKAGKVPSMRGAVASARMARASAAPQRREKLAEATNTRTAESNEKMLAAITRVADGARRTDTHVVKLTGYQVNHLLDRIRLIPWLHIDRTKDGLRFQVDESLRAICDGRRPRAALSYQSIDHFLRALRAEIIRRRKENHDEFQKRRWNHEGILKREQTSLLDWIEQELDRVPML